MLGWQTWHRVQSRMQIREHGVVPSLYFLKGYQIRTICAPVGATAGSLTSSHAHAIDPAILSPRAPFPGFQPRFVRSSPGPCRLKRAALLRWSRVVPAVPTVHRTDKYLHCLSIIQRLEELDYRIEIHPSPEEQGQTMPHTFT